MVLPTDPRLLAWGRRPACLPRLWLFTDSTRLPDPRAAVARLPRGAAGVVFRHDSDPARAALGRDLARLCRDRRLMLVVAGDARLAAALRAGMHLREGRWSAAVRVKRPGRAVITSSAHSIAGLRRARRAGAVLAFLSPVFPTASHPGQPVLGAARWCRMARWLPPGSIRVGALGGVDGGTIRRLPRRLCHAVGAINAFAP